jgi:hypothetical protein
MDKKVKQLLKKLNKINSLVIDNLNDQNIDSFNSIVSDFEKQIRGGVLPTVMKPPVKPLGPPIWTKFPSMTEEEIRHLFMNEEKYPDIELIKESVKGYVQSKKISNAKKRETIIKHIIARYNKGRSISDIGK